MSKQSLEVLSRVRYYRELMCYSQEDLADLVGTSLETIKQIELSVFVPSVRLALLISYALNVPVESLFLFELI